MNDRPTEQESAETPAKEDPGLFESIGSFPVWLLRIIHFITPDFLIKKSLPENKKPRN